MVRGKADCLFSAFHLSYNMIINLCRIEHVNPEQLMQSSFRQFQVLRRPPLPLLPSGYDLCLT